MTTETYAIIAATFFGPIFAVIITRFIDDFRATKERKFLIFRALMKDRASGVSDDYVAAINLIEVEFSKETKVMNAWKDVRDTHNKRPFDADHLQRKIYAMLQEIGKNLGYEIRADFLAGYAPEFWHNNFNRIKERDDLLIKLLQNEISLNINLPESNLTPDNK